jgi:exosortase
MKGLRWTPTYATGVAYLAGLAFLPIPFWMAEVWLGGVLGGGAAGMLTAPICMVLIWLATRQPAWTAPAVERSGAGWALLALAGLQIGALLLALGDRSWLMASGLLIPPFVFVWVWGLLGWSKATALSFPVFFGWFALPWEAFLRMWVDVPLQAWTADIAYVLLTLAGYPMRYWDDYTIYTYEFFVIVNETCSGMNMLVTLSMYTLIFTWVAQPSWRYRGYVLALLFPVSMLANGIRVAVIYLMGHHGDLELAMGFWHTGSAYIIFLPVFWFIYVVNNALLQRWQQRDAG